MENKSSASCTTEVTPAARNARVRAAAPCTPSRHAGSGKAFKAHSVVSPSWVNLTAFVICTVLVICSVRLQPVGCFSSYFSTYFTLQESAFEKSFRFPLIGQLILLCSFFRQTQRQFHRRTPLRGSDLRFFLSRLVHSLLSTTHPSLLRARPFLQPLTSVVNAKSTCRRATTTRT